MDWPGLRAIFNDPRVHTDKGYHTRAELERRHAPPAQRGASRSRSRSRSPSEDEDEAEDEAEAEDFDDGLIFTCNNETFGECMEKMLLGLPESKMETIRGIQPRKTALFLYNYSTRELHGVFEAVQPGALNIDPTAWTHATNARRTANACERRRGRPDAPARRSPFPAQVRFRIRHNVAPLREEDFRDHLTWEKERKFEPALGDYQTAALVAAFWDGGEE